MTGDGVRKRPAVASWVPGSQTRSVGTRGTLLFLAAVSAAFALACLPTPSSADPGAVVLPPVVRDVPDHPASILAGCSSDDRTAVGARITLAIEVGAPLYNAGDHLGCYHLYEATARAIEAALDARCSGPARAMREGRLRALGLPTDSARAWAMRDAFDGMLIALERY